MFDEQSLSHTRCECKYHVVRILKYRKADPFLISIAKGASCSFLTLIGHQSNILFMEPGDYRFGDYCRLQLPPSVLTAIIALPLTVASDLFHLSILDDLGIMEISLLLFH